MAYIVYNIDKKVVTVYSTSIFLNMKCTIQRVTAKTSSHNLMWLISSYTGTSQPLDES